MTPTRTRSPFRNLVRMMDDKDRVLIVEIGSSVIRGGFFPEPRGFCSPSLCYHYWNYIGNHYPSLGMQTEFYGEEAVKKFMAQPAVTPPRCIFNGELELLEDIANALGHLRYQYSPLNQCSDPVLVIIPAWLKQKPKRLLELIAHLRSHAFYQSPCIRLAIDSTLSALSYGVMTGIVLDCGADISRAIPIFEGTSQLQGMRMQCLGGSHLAECLHRFLGLPFRSPFKHPSSHKLHPIFNRPAANAATLQTLETILRERCFVSPSRMCSLESVRKAVVLRNNGRLASLPRTGANGDLEFDELDLRGTYLALLPNEVRQSVYRLAPIIPEAFLRPSCEYVIPTTPTTTVSIGAYESTACAEALFQPHLFPELAGTVGMAQLVFEAAMAQAGGNIALLHELLQNVMLAGASTCLPGFSLRLLRDLCELAPYAVVRVRTQPENLNTWTACDGAAVVLSSQTTPTFAQDEYFDDDQILANIIE